MGDADCIEVWRDHPGNFRVSSWGRISCDGVITRGKVYTGGYLYFRKYPIHRLVCEAFYGAPNGLYVNHRDGNRGNNRLSNLEYVTACENHYHAEYVLTGRLPGLVNGLYFEHWDELLGWLRQTRVRSAWHDYLFKWESWPEHLPKCDIPFIPRVAPPPRPYRPRPPRPPRVVVTVPLLHWEPVAPEPITRDEKVVYAGGRVHRVAKGYWVFNPEKSLIVKNDCF